MTLSAIVYPLIAHANTLTYVREDTETQIETVSLQVDIELEEPEPLTPYQLIEKYAAEYGVSVSIMWAVALCESSDGKGDVNPLAKNPYSTASGVFQWLKGSWSYYGTQLWGNMEGKDVFNPEHNIELAAYVMSLRGTVDWAASHHCSGV